MQKFEFASRPYVEELRRQIDDALGKADLTGIEFSISEEYTAPPAHLLGPGSRSIGFYIRISDGRIEVGDHPLDDADICIVADYQSVLPFVKLMQGHDPEQDAAHQEASKRLMQQGKLAIKGDMAARPPIFQQADLHNRLVPYTL